MSSYLSVYVSSCSGRPQIAIKGVGRSKEEEGAERNETFFDFQNPNQ